MIITVKRQYYDRFQNPVIAFYSCTCYNMHAKRGKKDIIL